MVFGDHERGDFNPLPRKEGDQFRSPFLPRRRLYFNPLPRKEGDGQKNIYISQAYVISIHSLVKRETVCPFCGKKSTKDFNPLPRKEGDMLAGIQGASGVQISIHSLVKRETQARNTRKP